MKALVQESGRVAQVEPDGKEFPVAPPLQWRLIPSGLDVRPDWTYDFATDSFTAPPPPRLPSWRELRRHEYDDEFGSLGEVVDVMFNELATRGASVTPEFDDMKPKRDAIKVRYSKP